MEGRALVLEYDAEGLFPLENKTSVPTAVLSKFFDADELPILQRPRRVWENEPPIPADKHERLLALLIWAHLIPEDLSGDDADALGAALKNNPRSLLKRVQQMQGRHEAHPANKIPIYRKEDRSWAVCPPFDREAGDVLVDIRRTDAIDHFRRDTSGPAAASDTPKPTPEADPEKPHVPETDLGGSRTPSDAPKPAGRRRDLDTSSRKTLDAQETTTSDTSGAVSLLLQLVALLLGLTAIAYAVISLL
jgi:hypothetical protein